MAVKTSITDSNQQALETAGRLQLDVLKEQNTRLAELLRQLSDSHEALETDRELIETLVAGLDAYQERMNTQIEVLIKLATEMRMYYEAIKREKS